MKILVRIIIFALVFYLCYSILAEAQDINRDMSNQDAGLTTSADSKKKTKIKEETPTLNEYEYDRSDDIEDEDLFPYDQDYLSRKLKKEKLDRLTRRENIIWSFRMANANIYL